jgi:protein phosphatase 2C-like protein
MSSERGPFWRPVVIGTPTADFEPRPAGSPSYRPDTVADGWSTGAFTVRLASVRGYDHRHRGTPRQDDVAVLHDPATGVVTFAVADGVSSAPHSHIGATAACRAALARVLVDLSTGPRVDWARVIEHAAWQVVEQACTVLGLDAPDAGLAEKELATTLITGLVRPGGQMSVVRVGDSAAWVLRDGRYHPLFDPKPDGDPVVTSAVTALPRVPDLGVHEGRLAPGDVLLVGTDGFGDALGDGTGPVGERFVTCLAAPRPPLAFAHDLDFSRETFDDDRTLLALWPRQMS